MPHGNHRGVTLIIPANWSTYIFSVSTSSVSGFVFFGLASGCGDGGRERDSLRTVGDDGLARSGVNPTFNTMQDGKRNGGQEPSEFSEEGIQPVVANCGGCISDSSSTIFGGGGGGGRSSYVFLPATSMGVGRQTACLSQLVEDKRW